MKAALVFFNDISADKSESVPYTSYRLSQEILKAGHLGRIFCLRRGHGVDIPEKYIVAVLDNIFASIMFRMLRYVQKMFSVFNARHFQEIIFDYYVAIKLRPVQGDVLFCTRPLFLKTARKARAGGMKVLVQTSIPHPLLNFALVKNEEIRLGLKSHGTYSDIDRAIRVSQVISEADKLITLDPVIGRFTHDSYMSFISPQKIVALREYFSVSLDAYSRVTPEKVAAASDGVVTFIHVSHMNLIKGIPYLLSAWELMQKRYSVKCKLILAGQMDKNIEQIYRKEYAQVPNIEVHGFVKDLVACYGEGDVFISPSISDAGPTSILEAMAAGLPVISSKNCGFASLIDDGEDGYTYQYNDTEKLCEIMYWFTQNTVHTDRMGRNARKKAERFSIDKYAQEIVGKIGACQ